MSGLASGCALTALVAIAGIACSTSSVPSYDGEGSAGASGGGGGGGSGGGGAIGCATAPIGCGPTQVCVAADCTRTAAQCMPITCVPNSNCCQASIPCTVEGGGTGCRSPIQTCIDAVPTPACANIGAGCDATPTAPTCACLPSNICPAGQVCVGVSAMRVVTCAAL
jgi:hypothetical protein